MTSLKLCQSKSTSACSVPLCVLRLGKWKWRIRCSMTPPFTSSSSTNKPGRQMPPDPSTVTISYNDTPTVLCSVLPFLTDGMDGGGRWVGGASERVPGHSQCPQGRFVDGCLLKAGPIWDQFLQFEATLCFSFEFLLLFCHTIVTSLSKMSKKNQIQADVFLGYIGLHDITVQCWERTLFLFLSFDLVLISS